MPRANKTPETQSETQEAVVAADTIDPSSPNADKAVLRALFEMVTVDKNPTVAMFWARARLGMNDKVGSRKEQKAIQVPAIVIRAEEKRA